MKDKIILYLRKIAIGIVMTIVVIIGLTIYNPELTSNILLLYETMPFLYTGDGSAQVFKIIPNNKNKENLNDEYMIYTNGIAFNENIDNTNGEEIVDIIKLDDTIDDFVINDIIGMDDIIIQEESTSQNVEEHFPENNVTIENIELLRDMEYLKKNFYTVDKLTDMTPDLFDVDKFVSKDFKINTESEEPQILIFHSHAATEGFSNSDPNDPMDGIVGVGARLAETLTNQYGLNVMHVTTRFDWFNGKADRNKAYDRVDIEIQRILDENPSIEVVLDVHRDGVREDVRLVTEIDGKPTAKVMFFNGLSKIYKNGRLTNIDFLPNQNLEDNLAFSFNMQLKANELYPGLMRKIYLKAYRFSLHMRPKSLLIEWGAQTNTKEEAFNAVEPIAEIIADVILN